MLWHSDKRSILVTDHVCLSYFQKDGEEKSHIEGGQKEGQEGQKGQERS